MNHIDFIGKYFPDCRINIILQPGYGTALRVEVSYLGFSEWIENYDDFEIIKSLDIVCDKLNRSIIKK